MAGLTALETVRAADRTVHDVGAAWMLDRRTQERGKDLGYAKPYAFYFAGRGGVLGDAHADVVTAAMGYWEPGVLRAAWDEGVAVAGAREAARRYGTACAAWGEDRLSGLAGGERLAELTERVVRAAEGAGLPLFCGWRAEPLAPAGPGRLMQLLNTLRELRGGLHLAATTAAGLSPLEAVLTSGGPSRARFLGWPGDHPDCDALTAVRAEAEETTDRLCAAAYERALTPSERAEFADLVTAAGRAALG